MKKLNLISLLLGAVLFTAMSVTTLSAEAPVMKKPACCKVEAPQMVKPACCEAKATGKACTCPKQVACTCKDSTNCTCPAGKHANKAPKKAMKCGKGKCG